MAECKRITVEPLTREAFAPFGKLIEFSEHPEDERFEVLIREEVHAFPLDAPVCLNKGVWHEVIALSGEALYKITENCEVSSEFYPFSQPVGVEICIPGKEEKA